MWISVHRPVQPETCSGPAEAIHNLNSVALYPKPQIPRAENVDLVPCHVHLKTRSGPAEATHGLKAVALYPKP